ncbi:hypothetical protein FZEAL_9332 [Fusarium zealandicum]|uniref:Uncharacterized protein n=1 Tax=Fusarium zealandicum TaxID=1053134 RepID=A0A8H4XFQ2_9HYPO|nr:hypothetical protein FZEAL_9332 [Fusarium zealandicum]
MTANGMKARQRTSAQKLIRQIRAERGYISQTSWDKMDSTVRQEVTTALAGVLKILEPTVNTLARDLYTSNAQFVFELLQNADNNHYTQVQSGEVPYVAFQMHQDRIIIECNQDSFNEDSIRAICAVDQSSKTGDQGYVGEKWIGFKSVFMAAWKVYIQSGPYSFYFQHRRDDPSMGMITPIWHDATEEFPANMTRMTLYLHDDGYPGSLLAQRDQIRQQLRDLRGEVLLFMRKLREIRISIFDQDDEPETTTIFSAAQTDADRVTVTESVLEDGANESTASIYHVTRHLTGSPPKSENNSYTGDEEKKKAYSSAEVVLAFPLTSQDIPIVAPQDVFAFLPIRHMGFSFLIQSDFVTQANQQDIVTTSARNIDLLDGISDAFTKAALQFCEHATLQYTWMRFLPLRENYPYDLFWSRLITMLEQKIRRTPLIRPRSEGALRLITGLRWPPCVFFHNEELLLPDLEPAVFVSRRYRAEDCETLEAFGMPLCSMEVFFDLAKQDLLSPMSRMRSKHNSERWHAGVANFIIRILQTNQEAMILELRNMRLLPLQNAICDLWVAPNSERSVYFAETEGLAIPEHLGFSLIRPSASANLSRRKLFELLGVQYLTVDSVRERILQRHRFPSSHVSQPSTRVRVDQIKFLYATHHGSSYQRGDYDCLSLTNDNDVLCRPCLDDLYIPDDNPLGPRELLKQTYSGVESAASALSLKVDFVHPLFLQDEPQQKHQESLTWRDWLVKHVGLRRLFRLTTKHSSKPALSDACHYVARYQAYKFLAFLSYHWRQEGKPIEENLALQLELQELDVLYQDGTMTRLGSGYMPLPELQYQCSRFLRNGEDSLLLHLEAPVQRSTYGKRWGFLVEWLGVGIDEDLDFYLSLLEKMDPVEGIEGCKEIFELYSVIYGKLLHSSTKEKDKEKVRVSIEEGFCIYVPEMGQEDSDWASPSICIWEGPETMWTKTSLKSKFEKAFAELGDVELLNLSGFFTDVLGIPDCTCFHIMEELRSMSSAKAKEPLRVCDLYERLEKMVYKLCPSDQDKIKQEFARDALIYTDNQGTSVWCRISDCIWSNETEFRRRATLSERYKHLRDFFVEFLGAQSLSLELKYRDLVHMGSSQEATIESVKSGIWALNSLIPTTSQLPNAKKLLDGKLFPVRHPDGQVSLEYFTTDFSIVDRTYLGTNFGSRVKTLDFTVDEVRRLEPILTWLGMVTRYLSRVVIESSRVEGLDKTALSSPQRSIRPRAHALYRIAYHYNSPRLRADDDLYITLRDIKVYETDGIASMQHICPRDKRSQESCYARKLPFHLYEWLMTNPTTIQQERFDEKGRRLVGLILNASPWIIPGILEDEGISLGDREDDYPESEGDDGLEPPSYTSTDFGADTSSLTTPASSLFSSPEL